MAIARYFRLSVLGGWENGSEWAGEQWQFGVSVVGNSDGSQPPRDVVKAPCPNANVDPSGETGASADFNWSYGFVGQYGQPMSTGNQQALGTQLKNFWNSVRQYAAQDQIMEGVKITAYQIGAGGRPEVINGSTFGYLKVPISGTATAFRLPPQCASVVSLRTSARGPGGRGRFYVPCTGATLSADGTLGGTEVTTLLNATQSLGTAISSLNGLLMAVVNQQTFTYSGIMQYGVGNHVDTQRRRANGVEESYTFVSALA